ncbi:MAG: Trm112 family protein [Gammaproteobacteria bacterium]
MDAELLQILVCPLCRGALEYDRENARLICRAEQLAFAITEDGIPVLLAEEAKPLAE